MGEQALLVLYVPLPALDEVVDPYRHPGALPAHVTMWPPWSGDANLSCTNSTIYAATRSHPWWEADFFATSWFGRRVVVLQPRDPDPFAAMRARLGEMPHPSDTATRPFVPHVTVATRWPHIHLLEAAHWASNHLPVRVSVTDVALARRDDVKHAWVEVCRWRLGEPTSVARATGRDSAATSG